MFELLSYDGYLCFITPPGWRSPSGNFRNVFNLIMNKKLIYLNMNDLESGHKVFNVAICYDYYIVKNIPDTSSNTEIIDIKDNKYKINLHTWDFIPFGEFKLFEKLLAFNNRFKLKKCVSLSLSVSVKRI